MDHILQILLTLIAAVILAFCCGRILQILQLSSYRTEGIFNWLKQTGGEFILRYFSLAFFSFLPMMVYWVCFRGYEYYISNIGFVIFVAIGIMFIRLTYKQFKVPIKYTPRMIRLTVVLIVLFAAAVFPLIYFSNYFWLFGNSLFCWLALLCPIFVLAAYYITLPIETLIGRKFIKKATKKLDSMAGLIKIGITGSYGKTTAKNILAEMLSSNFKVCKTPSSYNTLMGLCRTVNENLSSEDEIFIAEMGARHVGDIKELAEFIKPQYGMITAIGNMHIETFGSRENIAKTKYELIDSLDENGVAVFNGEDDFGKKFFEKTKCNKLMSFSKDSEIKAQYHDVKFGADGTEFILEIDGNSLKVTTKLLGKHIPSLITQCALLSYRLGVSPEDILDACARTEQIPHRLQVIKNGNITVIDDSFNSNPEGSKNAVEILQYFEGTKILITPGMVELGDIQSECNFEFGAKAAQCVDLIIAIAKNAESIAKGAAEAGMSEEKIIKCDTLDSATEIIKNLPLGQYVILYENDLPDNYR